MKKQTETLNLLSQMQIFLHVRSAKPLWLKWQGVTGVASGGGWCLDCQGVDEEFYQAMRIMATYKNAPKWFCKSCLPPAMLTIETELSIEENCKKYMTTLTQRMAVFESDLITTKEHIHRLEANLNEKADETQLIALKERLEKLEQTKDTRVVLTDTVN